MFAKINNEYFRLHSSANRFCMAGPAVIISFQSLIIPPRGFIPPFIIQYTSFYSQQLQYYTSQLSLPSIHSSYYTSQLSLPSIHSRYYTSQLSLPPIHSRYYTSQLSLPSIHCSRAAIIPASYPFLQSFQRVKKNIILQFF